MRLILLISITTFFLGFEKPEEKPNIEKYIDQWKSNLISKDGFVNRDECNYEKAEKSERITLGFPDEFEKTFADINEDGIIDALITFNPLQCDGGNASVNFQYALVILSKNSTFYTLEEIPSLNLGMSGYFYKFICAQNGSIKAQYYEYKEGDGRCCPSIGKEVILKIVNEKVKYK